MHINSDRLTGPLTQVELLHIENCTPCKIEREQLMALKLSANQLEVVTPPNSIWQNLEKQLPKQPVMQSKNKSRFIAVAASIGMVSLSWLFWSNYQLQQQFEDVLLANQLLEQQLYLESLPIYGQVAIISELEDITTQLYLAKDKKEKISLLNKRRKIFTQYLERKVLKGTHNEFSI